MKHPTPLADGILRRPAARVGTFGRIPALSAADFRIARLSASIRHHTRKGSLP